MKKTMSTLLVVAGTFAVSGAFAAVDKPNPNPNDCEQYGVSAHVEERYDDFSGYRSTATVTRPASYDGEVKATVTRERRDGSTYTETMDSEDYDYGFLSEIEIWKLELITMIKQRVWIYSAIRTLNN